VVAQQTTTQQPQPEVLPPPETVTGLVEGQNIEIQLALGEDYDVNDEIILENDKVIISFSNRGGVINQVTLKDFTFKGTEQMVFLVPEGQAFLQTEFIGSKDNIIYKYEKSDLRESVVFTSQNPETLAFIQKTYTLSDGYHLDFVFEGEGIPAMDSYSISLNSGINVTEHNKSAIKEQGEMFKFIGDIDAKTQSISQNKLRKGNQQFVGRINWAAVRSKYFVLSLIPANTVMTQSVSIQRISENVGFTLFIKNNNRVVNFYDQYSLYLGPVDHDILVTYHNGMEHITELGGWLRPISKLFMYYIRFLHRFISNYGIVIIIFALTLKILLTPLTNKSLNSGRKLQQIQPKMREIQAKYKNDIKTQQEELRKLYKEHNVSPLGGCLPLLLQMPIFFALYPVLRSSLEFRQAHFFGWLVDLSTPDPYWILPIIMGIFMFIQQKMMQATQDTSNMDEKQAAMMQTNKMMSFIMPPFMVFIFSGLPAGLVLYWTTFNIFSIIQQYWLQKKQQQEGKI